MRTKFVLPFAIGLFAAGPTVAGAAPPDPVTIKYLYERRNGDGGYAPAEGSGDKPPASSLRATGAALRALKYLGARPSNPADIVAFVERCFDPTSGGFGDAPGQPPTAFSTAVGAMTAAELKMPAEPYRAGAVKFLNEQVKGPEEIRIAAAAFEMLQLRPSKADDWLRLIALARNPDGTFGGGTGVTRATGGTAATILRLGGTIDRRDAIVKALRDGQRSDGGFGDGERAESDLESSYRVMRAFSMMKERPADPAKLRSFVIRCRSANGGYGECVGRPPSVSATYYAAIILHWLDQQ